MYAAFRGKGIRKWCYGIKDPSAISEYYKIGNCCIWSNQSHSYTTPPFPPLSASSTTKPRSKFLPPYKLRFLWNLSQPPSKLSHSRLSFECQPCTFVTKEVIIPSTTIIKCTSAIVEENPRDRRPTPPKARHPAGYHSRVNSVNERHITRYRCSDILKLRICLQRSCFWESWLGTWWSLNSSLALCQMLSSLTKAGLPPTLPLMISENPGSSLIPVYRVLVSLPSSHSPTSMSFHEDTLATIRQQEPSSK